MIRASVLVALLILGGCTDIPKDPKGTLDRIRAERVFRVAMIEPLGGAEGKAAANTFLERVAHATGAKVSLVTGAAEPLLLRLEDGQVDLVIGTMAPDSPWIPRVAMLPSLLEQTRDRHLLLTPIARNGENAWIMLLEREAHATRAEQRR